MEEDENFETKKFNIKKGIIFGALFLIIIFYGIYEAYELIKKPTNTVTVLEGKLYLEESAVGYVIREETVEQIEDPKNGVEEIKTEGEKVAKDDVIFRCYGEKEAELTQKLQEINSKIQKELEKSSYNNTSDDINILDTKIDKKIKSIKTLSSVQDVLEYKKDINTLLSKKLALISQSNEVSDELNDLITQKKQYEELLLEGGDNVTASQSGVVSYRVDGLEESFKTDDFNYLNFEFMDNLNLKTGQIISSSNECAKIVNNYKCYIAFTSNSNEANFACVGDKITIGLSTGDEVPAQIIHTYSENDRKIIVVEINRCVDKLISYRKISIDVVWWSDKGLKVLNDALINADDLYYVVRNRVGYLNKIVVKVLRKNENYAIVTNYTTDELLELGFEEGEIKKMKKLKLYDDLILNPSIQTEF